VNYCVVDWHAALRMYRGMFLVILFIFLLGINTYGWRSSGVNHVLIFELDPRNHLNHQELLEVLLQCLQACLCVVCEFVARTCATNASTLFVGCQEKHLACIT